MRLDQPVRSYFERGRTSVIALSSSVFLSLFCALASAQVTSSEVYSTFQNSMGVADTLTERLIAERQGAHANNEVQALEHAIDPATYQLGPGDGVYLNVYAVHGLDQDLTVTPEGRLLIPGVGPVDVAGLSIIEAEQKVRQALAKDYRSPDVSLSLRRLRPIKVNVIGDVLSAGMQTAIATQRVSEVIERSGGFKENSSLRNIEIRTPTGALRAKADLVKYYSAGDLSANPRVEAGDVIVVPQATRFILVSGSVANPQRLEFVPGDSLSTVIALCRGLLPSAVPDSIQIARYPANDPVHTEWKFVNYANGENPALHEGDEIFIRSNSQYHVPRLVSIAGEVPYPGQYPIEPGSTRLKDVLLRAGGTLSTASLQEAVLIRRTGIGSWEADPEFLRIKNIGPLLKEGLSEQEYSYYEARLDRFFRATMVVDFKALMSGDSSQNLLLREQDSIYIPRAMGYITVSGAVNNQGNVRYIDGGSWRDYVEEAGGFSATADRSQMRIVSPKTGSYVDPQADPGYQISPGDMLIVPQERPTFWKDVGSATAITAQMITIVAGLFLLYKNK